ncbi:MAG TPA: DsbA family oxidoreductase, partial [Clostridiaceae bacterium]|nr:DsbA family oxidoreductase [Clostridiaceae bacterium]
MKIDVYSDFVCPFCYIGKRLLEQAIETLGMEADVTFKSYELDPLGKSDPNVSVYEELAKKYNKTVKEAKEMNDGITARAKEVGLTYRLDNAKKTNTLDAHRLHKFAQTKGLGEEMAERLLSAYFTESEFLGSKETLVRLAGDVGLDKAEVEAVLNDQDAFRKDVKDDQQDARNLGVRGVPFFVLNGKYAISGAQPLEVFVRALKQAN